MTELLSSAFFPGAGATSTPHSLSRRVLVSVGEASGDAMAAAVAQQLDAPIFGMTGPELEALGSERVANVTSQAALGWLDVITASPRAVGAYRRLLDRARELMPKVALLVGHSEVNARLGVALRRQGTRVLWYAPPQVWVWRPKRVFALRHAADAVACLLPFERNLWQRAGVAAHYVGHPALEMDLLSRTEARRELGLTPYAEVAAILPGSRTREVQRTLPALLAAASELREERGAFDARVLLAPTLDDRVVAWASALALRHDVRVSRLRPRQVLSAFDVALATSGTVTLECALAGVAPVIVYRTDALSSALLRRMLRVPNVGLPNLVLGRRAFPELLQEELTPTAVTHAALDILDEPEEYAARLREVRRTLEDETNPRSPSARVADVLKTWLND
ncbi:MAG: lipid-A-disaccharide synthase [Polyangiaceae bacterium]